MITVSFFGPACACSTVQAIAGEAGVPFFYRAGSEFEEM